MNCFTYSFYVLVIGLLRLYKWIELQFLLLVNSFVSRKLTQEAANLNVVLHRPGEDNENHAGSQDEAEDESNLLLGRQGKEDRLIHIKGNRKTYLARIANLGSLSIGETFMDKSWDVYDERWEDVTSLIRRILDHKRFDAFYKYPVNRLLDWLEHDAFNLQTRQRAFQVGKVHYDLGNDLYEAMLDPWLQYTCGYWKDATNLNDAQVAKMELIAKKLELQPGMRVLDIGCGWGTLLKYLAENYKVECVGVTIGEEGAAYGRRVNEGLPVEIRVQDYRDLEGKFDRILSIGMFEHVGTSNYKEFFDVASRCLKDDGIFLLHTIGKNHYNHPKRSEMWLQKYIFPNGMLPLPTDVTKATKGRFVIEDWHNFGQDYAKTLYCWRKNFIKAWPQLESKYGGEHFFRMWIYYLSMCRAVFLSRTAQLWQLVLSKDGLRRDYRAYR